MISLKNIFTIPAPEKFWVLLDQLLVSGVAFVTTLIAARQLGIINFALFSSIILLQLLILAIQNALIIAPYQVLHADFARLPERKKYDDATFLLQTAFTVVVVFLASAFFVIVPHLPEAVLQCSGWIILAVSGFIFQDYLRRIFITNSKARLAFWVDMITNFTQILILSWICWLHRLNLSRTFMVIGLTYIPSAIVGIYWLQLKKITLDLFLTTWQKHYLHGKWLLLTSLLQWWAGNSFLLAAGLNLGIQTFGALRLAQSIFGPFNVLLQAFENYVIPNAARLHKEPSGDLLAYLKIVCLKSAFFILPILLAIFIFARFILDVTGGGQFAAYAAILQGMTVLYLLVFLGFPVRLAIRVLLLNKSFFIGYCLTAAFSFLAANSFILWWGAGGVIAGLAFNQLLMLSYWSFILQRRNFVLWKLYM